MWETGKKTKPPRGTAKIKMNFCWVETEVHKECNVVCL